MPFTVLLAADAERDIEDIWGYVADRDGTDRANGLLDELEDACRSLSEMPDRGNVPKELAALGMTAFRELHIKPYRLIYRIATDEVVVYCVLDGRRDMQSLLQRRLLR